MSRPWIAFALAGVLVTSACSRGDSLDPVAAVEVLVLDGVDREQAVCVIDTVDGRLDLAKVTGLDVDLTPEELSLLAAATGNCRTAMVEYGGVLGGDVAGLDPLRAGAEANGDLGVERFVEDLVAGGLDTEVGVCVLDALLRSAQPEVDIADDRTVVSLMVDCGTVR